MDRRSERALVEETKVLIEEVESGDTAHAAWVAIQDRVQRLCEGRTQAEVAELLGRSRRWVQDIVRWDAHRGAPPFARPESPGKRGISADAKRAINERPQAVAKAIVEAEPEQRKEIIEALASDDRTFDEVTEASTKEWVERQKQGKPSPTPKVKRRGAIEAWGSVIGRGRSAEHQAKLCLEEIKSVDEAIPDDLNKDALDAAERAITAWEYVRATLRGESVGDQAEEYLARLNQ